MTRTLPLDYVSYPAVIGVLLIYVLFFVPLEVDNNPNAQLMLQIINAMNCPDPVKAASAVYSCEDKQRLR
jgi:hypothetical protein